MAPAVGQTMQIGDDYLNGGHLPPKRPLIDGLGDRVPQCRLPHANNNSVSQQLCLTPGRRSVLPDVARQTTTHIANCHGGRQDGWSSAVAGVDLTLMSLHAAYYFYKIDIGYSLMPIRRCSSML